MSKDRDARVDYQEALEKAIREVQQWYGHQLNGVTFKLNEPIVEVAHSSKPAEWFSAHENGKNRDDWGYYNILAEAHELLGAKLNDPNFIWVVYSDGPGNKGRGGSGVACLPEDDLLGLIGRHPTQKKKARWIGGLGHELGHAFGLPHPQDTRIHADAIMWAGFYNAYPDSAYLTARDKQMLLHNPFFFNGEGQSITAVEKQFEIYNYSGGYFANVSPSPPANWVERKFNSPENYFFDEVERDGQNILIKDPDRNFQISIPIKGGDSRISINDGPWQTLYNLTRETRVLP